MDQEPEIIPDQKAKNLKKDLRKIFYLTLISILILGALVILEAKTGKLTFWSERLLSSLLQ